MFKDLWEEDNLRTWYLQQGGQLLTFTHQEEALAYLAQRGAQPSTENIHTTLLQKIGSCVTILIETYCYPTEDGGANEQLSMGANLSTHPTGITTNHRDSNSRGGSKL